MKHHNLSNWIFRLALSGLLTLGGHLSAQFPAPFTYQGRLTDGNGPANGQYDLTFGLHGTATGGSAFVVQTNAPVQVVDGLFTVVLDFTDTAFIGFDRWLEIGVRTNGATEAHTLLAPRQAITATPYAIHAGTVNASGIIGQVTDSQIATVLSVPRTFNHPANQFTGTFTGSFFGNGAGLTNLNVGSVSGVLPASGLSGFYSNILGLTNVANQFYGTFTGIGSGLTNVNASTLEGHGSEDFWKVGGNAGITGSDFIGTTDFQSLRFRVEGFEALRIVPTGNIPNIVGGFSQNPEGLGASIGGGSGHQATNNWVTIAGGRDNKADGEAVAIGGGNNNFAKGAGATISGGGGNVASGNTSTIGGGLGNSALEIHSTVGGGLANRAIGFGSTIGGGELNTTDDLYSTVPGGRQNEALGPYSLAAGRRARALHGGTFVWADNTDADFNSTAGNQFLVRAAGGVGINTPNTAGNALTVNGAVNATSFVGDGSGLTGLSFGSLSGFLPAAGLSGFYSNILGLTNLANQFGGTFNGTFSGDGSGLTGVPGLWSEVGNDIYFENGQVLIGRTSPTTDEIPLVLRAGPAKHALRMESPDGSSGWEMFSGSDGLDFAEVNVAAKRLHLAPGGNVGIGTDLPTSRLHVTGSGLFEGTVSATSFVGDGSGLTGLSFGSLSGFLPAAGLSGFYSNVLGLTNTANQFYGTFTGIGSGLTNVNASTLEGHGSGDFWKVGGNAGVTGSEFIGTTDFQSLRFRVEGFEALRMVPTGNIPNIVGGFSQNPVGIGASIGGGTGHQATNNFVTIAGGHENKADGEYVAIGGGNGNFAKGAAATISGGNANIASGNTSTIGGGLGNSALDIHSTVGGGVGNRAIGFVSTVGGGELNVADDLYSTVPGGRQNEALGPYSFAAGRRARALHGGTFVWADNTDEDFNSAGANQFLIRAAGGVGINTANTAGNALTVDGTVNATSFVGDGSGLTGLTFSSLGGVLPSVGLSGVYENFVGLTNTANQFHGTFYGVGSGLTDVNSSFLNGLQSGDFWQLEGNAGTTPGTHFIGTTDNKALQFKVNNARAMNIQAGNADGTGAPNIAAGFSGNTFNPDRRGAVIAGGGETGSANTTGDNFATVGGGSGNSGSGEYSVVGGGLENSSTLNFTTVAGGRANLANAAGAMVGGGEANTASGQAAAVVGGLDNLASGSSSFVGGGQDNQSTTNFATVGGGFFNLATGHGSTVSGGQSNVASTNDTVVAGGTANTASGLQGTVSGGSLNVASGHRSTVSGGSQNISSGDATTVGGGTFNVAQTNHATVAGGFMNQATNELATVGGGERNIAGGAFSTVSGGLQNAALGELSQASGYRAKALHQGTYVWSDSQTFDFSSSAQDQYLIRAQGGVGINTANTTGSALAVNGKVSASSFEGDGSGLTGLSYSSLGGVLPSVALSGQYSSAVDLSNAANVFQGTFVGDGSGLTGVGSLWTPVQNHVSYQNGQVLIGLNTPTFNDIPLVVRAGPQNHVLRMEQNDGSPGWEIFSGTDGLDFTEVNVAAARLHVAPGGNVGVGTPVPNARLDVRGDGVFTGGLTVEGSGAPLVVDSKNQNRFKIELKENGVTTSYLGSQSHSGVQYAFAVADSNAVTRMVVQQDGFVGIGTNPTHLLHINGVGRSTSSTWATSSDARAKENIREVKGSLDRLNRLRPVTFEYKDEYQGDHQGYDGEYTGFIAQEVEEVFPDMVSVAPDTIGGQEVEDFRVLNTGSLTPHLVSGLQELRAEKDRQIQQLQEENQSLQDRLAQLEKVVQSLMAQ